LRPTDPTVAAIVRDQTGVAWSRARDLCTEGRVTVNGERCLDSALRVPPGAVVVVDERAPKLRPGALPESAIAFFDRDVVVVDKPAGMLSIAYEPGDKDTLADCTRTLLRRMGGRRFEPRVGVVHRLDKDTSGLMVFARTLDAKRILEIQFRAHDIERVYHAIAHGAVAVQRVETHFIAGRGDGIRAMGIGSRKTFLRPYLTGNTSSPCRECCGRYSRAGADCSGSCAISWSDC
jgi:23S rRNA pseudouridine1911/1915/1917 synthase